MSTAHGDRGAADRPVRWRRAGSCVAAAVLAFGLQQLAARFPDATERLYSQGVFPLVARALTTLTSWSPVAVGECLLLALVGVLVGRAVAALVAWRRGRRSLRNVAAHGAARAAVLGGLLFVVFQLVWGLNHARLPFARHVGLEPAPASRDELARVARLLVARAAAARPSGLDPVDGLAGSDWRAVVRAAYDEAGQRWPVLSGPPPPIRLPWISKLMTLASVTGIYSPFTGEPNVNGDMPDVLRPFVACHEVAHLRGFAREDEANFIAWWVGSRSPDARLRYSCELQAYRIAMGELWSTDFGLWSDLRESCPEAVRADSAAIAEFWHGQPKVVHEVLSTISRATNDAYLKSSGHGDGVRSYGRMVDLLIAALRAE